MSGEARPDTLQWRPDIFGYSWDILPFYERVARELPDPCRCAEVGVLYGRSILFLAERLRELGKGAELHAVDSWEWAQHPNATKEALKALSMGVEGGDAIREHRIDSALGARLFPHAWLDLVFIDADHSEEAVLMDIDAWLPRVKPGGLISGHDYHRDEDPHVGVRRAVQARFSAGEVRVEGSVWSVVVRP